ncbi:MAG: hypothetical protein DME76_03525 [Verrucomicrobia bacterium]|nr:MAG: hypothetical protein DME76_03525 [Verrucomicrobiota bacterium]
MFHVYILRSSKTGRRYVGSCENLSERLRRHNLGHSKATRHGMPWTLVHSESFSSRAEVAKRERYYKSGLGRDELECLGLWCGRRGDRSRVQIPPARFFSNQDILGPRLRFLRRKSATADSSCGERDARATLRHAQRWNCRAAECRKIDAFQCGHAHAQGAGRKLSVLHDRSKRGCGNRP